MNVSPVLSGGLMRSLAASLLIVGLTAMLPACKPAQGNAGPPQGGARPPAPVRVGATSQKVMPVEVITIGNVEPIQSVQIKAQVSGLVTKVAFKEGDAVQSGQLLFMIDTRPFEVALREAEANLAKSQAQLEQAQATVNKDKAQAEYSRSVLTRDQDLVKKGMVSPEEFDNSKANAAALQAAVAADEANIKAAAEAIGVSKAAIDDAKLQLDYCTIRSPLTGRTGMVMLKEGNLVKANDTVVMVVINQIAPIYVDFALAEKYLVDLQKYSAQGPITVTASPSGEGGDPVKGELTFIDNAVDDSTGTIHLKATFENQDNRLWPGQSVRVTLQMTVEQDAVVVPAQAVQSGQGGAYVFVVTPDKKAALRKITTGDTVNDLTVVKEGLKPGESVVTDGQMRLMDGAPVNVLTDAPAAGESAQ